MDWKIQECLLYCVQMYVNKKNDVKAYMKIQSNALQFTLLIWHQNMFYYLVVSQSIFSMFLKHLIDKLVNPVRVEMLIIVVSYICDNCIHLLFV